MGEAVALKKSVVVNCNPRVIAAIKSQVWVGRSDWVKPNAR